MTLARHEIVRAYKKGLRRPLEVFLEEVTRTNRFVKKSSLEGPCLVVISGGSARNPYTKMMIISICAYYGLQVKFTNEFSPLNYRYVD